MILLVIDWANALDVVGFGIGMVFILLVLLVVVLSLFSKAVAPKVRVPKQRKRLFGTVATKAEKETEEFEEDHLSANDSAAIAMALHLYYAEMHDVESTIITIKTVERRYSPWSSKIYGLNYFRK